MGPAEVCSEVISYFGKIANSGEGRMPDVVRCDGGLEHFSVERTADLLRCSKKSDSMVVRGPAAASHNGLPG